MVHTVKKEFNINDLQDYLTDNCITLMLKVQNIIYLIKSTQPA